MTKRCAAIVSIPRAVSAGTMTMARKTYAAEIEAEPETDVDEAEAARVGGPFATEEFERPPFD